MRNLFIYYFLLFHNLICSKLFIFKLKLALIFIILIFSKCNRFRLFLCAPFFFFKFKIQIFFIFIKIFVCPERTVYSQTLNLKPKSDHIVYKILSFIKLEIWTWIKSDNERCFCKQKTTRQFNDFFNILEFEELKWKLYYFVLFNNLICSKLLKLKFENWLNPTINRKLRVNFVEKLHIKVTKFQKKDTWGRI